MARMGRPLIFESVEKLQIAIDEYFEITPEFEVTITGLALHLNTSRETLMNYEKKSDFFDAIKTAKDKVQLSYEKDLRRKGRSGDIFALKNFGWSDKQEVDHTSQGDKMNVAGFTYAVPKDDDKDDKKS